MRIGIDIDDTITNSWECMIPHYAKLFGISEDKLKKSKPYYNAISDLISLDEYYKVMLPIYDKYTKDITIKDNVKEVIDRLYELGHKVYFITARGIDYTNAHAETKAYLDRYGIKYDKIIVDTSNKAQACLDNKIDLFIDDSPKHCMSVRKVGINVIMFDAYYNKNYRNFKRISNWNQIFKYIKDR